MVSNHSFVFNAESNGGESFILVTRVLNADPVDLEQTLTLCSYCNAAQFTLAGAALTPEKLRSLADELDEVIERKRNENS